jgi:hypothetical protein
MQSLFIRLFLLMAIAIAASTAMKAHSGGVSEREAKNVQAVIMAQLEAFAGDDEDSAFATTTPAVRKAIGDAHRFLALVQATYPMVYRPSTVVFHKPEAQGGTVLQLVELTDSHAKSWMAMFTLEKQPDASWRISGCVVAENRWLST